MMLSGSEEEDHSFIPHLSETCIEICDTSSTGTGLTATESYDRSPGRNLIFGLSKRMFALVAFLVIGTSGIFAYAVGQWSRVLGLENQIEELEQENDRICSLTSNTDICDGRGPSPSAATTPSAESVSEPTSAPSVPAEHCGCADCTEQIWNTLADEYTCGARINYVTGHTTSNPTEVDACRLVAGVEFPTICGPACNPDSCDGRDPSSSGDPAYAIPSTEAVSEPTFAPNNNPQEPTKPAEHCGCYDCTEQVWNALADTLACGARIIYVAGDIAEYPTEADACRLVAGEFPTICGPACNPDNCDGRDPSSSGDPADATQSAVAVSEQEPIPPFTLTPESSIYCFPEYAQRTRYEDVWGKYTVEVKEGITCGPADNAFTTDTVSLDSNELKLQFKKGDNGWEGSEVRIILPEEEMPFIYGTYSFSVKGVVVLDASTSAVIDTVLPQSLVLGLTTWDDTEIDDIHENWNHEVDIQISRWNKPNNADTQFLVQPPESPQLYRFYSGLGSTYNQGGHVYEFAWNPGKVTWYTDAAGGMNHSYATEDALFAGLNDYVQCLPADVEVRINLWNMFGNVLPIGMLDSEIVQVVIDDFSFTPSNLQYVLDGGYCTKHCQCDTSSMCVNGICTSDFEP
jgi:hypothetical protein